MNTVRSLLQGRGLVTQSTHWPWTSCPQQLNHGAGETHLSKEMSFYLLFQQQESSQPMNYTWSGAGTLRTMYHLHQQRLNGPGLSPFHGILRLVKLVSWYFCPVLYWHTAEWLLFGSIFRFWREMQRRVKEDRPSLLPRLLWNQPWESLKWQMLDTDAQISTR